MPRFAANLSMMYTEFAFLDRFGKAAKNGFKGVECLFPYDFPVEEIKARLDAHGLEQILFNAPPGDWSAGERGIACLPGREEEFRHGLEQALHYAEVLGTTRLHVMAGLVFPGQDKAHHREVYLQNLLFAARHAQRYGVTILIEAINTRDMPAYFLDCQKEARAIRDEIGEPNLKVQFDLYHCQIMQGDLAATMRHTIGGIGHMQIAGVPARNEPDIGEIHYPYLFELMDELGYDGWVGCEYRPKAGTSEGLGWLNAWLRKRD